MATGRHPTGRPASMVCQLAGLLQVALIGLTVSVVVVSGQDCKDATITIVPHVQQTLSPGADLTVEVGAGSRQVLKLDGVAEQGAAINTILKATAGACKLHVSPGVVPSVTDYDYRYAPVVSDGSTSGVLSGFTVDGLVDGLSWYFVLEGVEGQGGCTASVRATPVVSKEALLTAESNYGQSYVDLSSTSRYAVLYFSIHTGEVGLVRVYIDGGTSCRMHGKYESVSIHNTANVVDGLGSGNEAFATFFADGVSTDDGKWWVVVEAVGGVSCSAVVRFRTDFAKPYGQGSYMDWQTEYTVPNVPAGECTLFRFRDADNWNGMMYLEYKGPPANCAFYASYGVPRPGNANVTRLVPSSASSFDSVYIVAEGMTDRENSHYFYILTEGVGLCSGASLIADGFETVEVGGSWTHVDPGGLAGNPNRFLMVHYGTAAGAEPVGGFTLHDGRDDSACRLYYAIGRIPVPGQDAYITGQAHNPPYFPWVNTTWVAHNGGDLSTVNDFYFLVVNSTEYGLCSDSPQMVFNTNGGKTTSVSEVSPSLGVAEHLDVIEVNAETGKGGLIWIQTSEQEGNCTVWINAGSISTNGNTFEGESTDVYLAEGIADGNPWFIVVGSTPANLNRKEFNYEDGMYCKGNSVLRVSLEETLSLSSGVSTSLSLVHGNTSSYAVAKLAASPGYGGAVRLKIDGDSSSCEAVASANVINTNGFTSAIRAGSSGYFFASGADLSSSVAWYVIVRALPGQVCSTVNVTLTTEPIGSVTTRSPYVVSDATVLGGYAVFQLEAESGSSYLNSLDVHFHANGTLCELSPFMNKMSNGDNVTVIRSDATASTSVVAESQDDFDVWLFRFQLCPSSGCGNCTYGTYSADGVVYCQKCDEGHYAASLKAQECTAASVGYHVPSPGMGSQIACTNGTYQTSTGQASCLECSKGEYQDEDAQTGCKQCVAGFASSSIGSPYCDSCDGGAFSGSQGAGLCDQCAAGSYADGIANTGCTLCPIGTYTADAGSTSCIACPLLSSTSATGASTRDLCQCADGYYGAPLEGRECQECPSSNAVCSKGDSYPTAKSGFWLTTSEPNTVMACSPASACPGGQEKCSTGYIGEACSSCDSGYYRSNGQCHKCVTDELPEEMAITIIVMMFLASPLFTCLIFCCSGYIYSLISVRDSVSTVDSTSGSSLLQMLRSARSGCSSAVKSGVNGVRSLSRMFKFFQLSFVVFSLDMEWPASIRTLARIFSMANLNFDIVFQPECSAGAGIMNYRTKFIIRLLIPIVVLVAVANMLAMVVVVRLLRCSKKRLRLRHWAENTWSFMIRGMLMFLNLFYIFLASTSIELLTCYNRDDNYYLIADPTIQCFSNGVWLELLPFCLAAISFYLLGTFALFAFILIRKRWRKKPSDISRVTEMRYGFLWDPYQPRYFWWELMVLANKLMVTGVMPASALGTQDQINYLLLITLFSLLVVVRVTPLAKARDNMLEFSILFAVFYSVMAAFVFISGEIKDGTRYFFETTVLMVHAWVWMVLAYVLVHDLGVAAATGGIRSATKSALYRLVRQRSHGNARTDCPSTNNDSGGHHQSQQEHIREILMEMGIDIPLENLLGSRKPTLKANVSASRALDSGELRALRQLSSEPETMESLDAVT